MIFFSSPEIDELSSMPNTGMILVESRSWATPFSPPHLRPLLFLPCHVSPFSRFSSNSFFSFPSVQMCLFISYESGHLQFSSLFSTRVSSQVRRLTRHFPPPPPPPPPPPCTFPNLSFFAFLCVPRFNPFPRAIFPPHGDARNSASTGTDFFFFFFLFSASCYSPSPLSTTPSNTREKSSIFCYFPSRCPEFLFSQCTARFFISFPSGGIAALFRISHFLSTLRPPCNYPTFPLPTPFVFFFQHPLM